jgi:hypothetical protein
MNTAKIVIREMQGNSSFWVRASSASELAPPRVATQSGALVLSYGLGWWLDRDLYSLTDSECDLDSDHAVSILSESPVCQDKK